MSECDIERKLDAIVSILKLVYKEELAEARAAIRKDPGKAAILDAAADWVAAGSLVGTVAQATKRSERSIRRYVVELLDLGLLEKRGAAKATEYRAGGLI